MKNVVLIGMPGAGKSTVGVVLAKKLGFHFVDCDLVIQEQTGKLLHEIIEEKGIDGFLRVENDCIAGLTAPKAVIATGGSAVYGKEAMEHLKEGGRVIYLQLSYDSLRKRLGNLEERGVALREGQGLKELYRERVPLYEQYADRTVACKGKKIREVVGETAAWVLKKETAEKRRVQKNRQGKGNPIEKGNQAGSENRTGSKNQAGSENRTEKKVRREKEKRREHKKHHEKKK